VRSALSLWSVSLGHRSRKKGRFQLWGRLSDDKSPSGCEIQITDLPFLFFTEPWLLVLKKFSWIRVRKCGLGWEAVAYTNTPERYDESVLNTQDDSSLKAHRPEDLFDLPLRVEVPKNLNFITPHFVFYGSQAPSKLIVNNAVCEVKLEGRYDSMAEYNVSIHKGPMFVVNPIGRGLIGGRVYVVRVVKVHQRVSSSPLAQSRYLLPSHY